MTRPRLSTIALLALLFVVVFALAKLIYGAMP
jgi:hypothetical protein